MSINTGLTPISSSVGGALGRVVGGCSTAAHKSTQSVGGALGCIDGLSTAAHIMPPARDDCGDGVSSAGDAVDIVGVADAMGTARAMGTWMILGGDSSSARAAYSSGLAAVMSGTAGGVPAV
jgi:hypothetical protein